MELIDNSIDAGASNVWIHFDSEANTLGITDDGSGMSMAKIADVMNLGYERGYTDTEIGYFGAGLKSGLINLIDLKATDSMVEIVSYDGQETSKVIWNPSKDGFNYTLVPDSDGHPFGDDVQSGTAILIHGVININRQVLKKELGKMYYPSLSVDAIKLTVSEGEESVQILPTDPLYRTNPKTQHNTLEAKVDDHTIEVHGVLLDEFQEKHQGERKTKKPGAWAMEDSGCYVVYGGRYIEAGGLLGWRRMDPWINRTRIEFTIPKKLTPKFGLKFNKTGGLRLDRNDTTSDLEQKVNDIITWGKNVRLKNSETLVSVDEKQQLQEVEDELNKSAKRARLKKPVSEPKGGSTTRRPRKPTSEPTTVVDPPTQKGEPIIHPDKIFNLSTEPMKSTEVFWCFEWQNKQFFLTLNENHAFYQNIYRQMGLVEQKQMAMLLGAMAHAQYETMSLDEVDGENVEKFWQRFWSLVSTNLNHMYLS